MERFLITSSYRGHNNSIIWQLEIDDSNMNLEKCAKLSITDNNLLPNLYDHSAFGIFKYNNLYYLSEANAIRIVDYKFNTLYRYQDTNLFRHLHDICIIDDEIYVTNTLCDTIEIFSLDLKNHIKTISVKEKSFFRKMNLVSKKNPTSISDCLHINYISEYKNDIYLSMSFINKRKIGISKKWPFLLKVVQDYGLLYNFTQDRVLKLNLKGNHDGIWYNDSIWCCQSHYMTIDNYSEKGELILQKKFKDAGIYRGLAVTDKYVIVGATKVDFERAKAHQVYHKLVKKRGGSFPEKSRIYILDKDTLKTLKIIELDDYKETSPEIYEIIFDE